MGKLSKLVEFWTRKLFQIRGCVISARRTKHLDTTTMFTYSHVNTPLRQSKRAYYLSYFINSNVGQHLWRNAEIKECIVLESRVRLQPIVGWIFICIVAFAHWNLLLPAAKKKRLKIDCAFEATTELGNWWSAFPAHVVGELPCGSPPTAPTCFVWSALRSPQQ